MTTPDLDALIEQFPEINPGNYGEDDAIALNNWGIDAVAALAELQADNERLAKRGQKYRDDWERAEAHIAALEADAEVYRAEVAALAKDAERALQQYQDRGAAIAALIADRDALRAKLDAGCPTCAAAVRMQRLIDDRQS